MCQEMKFTGTVTKPSYSYPGSGYQVGWVIKIEKYVQDPADGVTPYPVGEEVAWASGCFVNDVSAGDKVLVEYTGDNDKSPAFRISKI